MFARFVLGTLGQGLSLLQFDSKVQTICFETRPKSTVTVETHQQHQQRLALGFLMVFAELSADRVVARFGNAHPLIASKSHDVLAQ